MMLSDAIGRYLADKRAKGYAANTIRHHRTTLNHLLADIGNIQLSSIQPRHIDIFWSKHEDWGPGNFNKNRSTLRTFFTWAQARGYMPKASDPMEGVRKRKVPPKDWLIIPETEFDSVLDAAGNPRDRALVAVGLYLFTRGSESTAIRWGDINWDTKEITVNRGKTTTLDVLPMCSELEKELRRWRLAYAESVGEVPKPAWFLLPAYTKPVFKGRMPGGGRTPIYQAESVLIPTRQFRDATRRVQTVLTRAGYPELDGEGGHTLRRSGATALYNELSDRGHDRSIRMVQAMLGHTSISTTEVYLRLDLDRKTRNDLLAGKPMFGGGQLAEVRSIEKVAPAQSSDMQGNL